MQNTDAIAFHTAAALDAYEQHLAELRETGDVPGLIAPFDHQLRRVCACCLQLPQLSGASVALLLSHHRLLADLARRGESAPIARASTSFRAVEQCVRRLQHQCRELFLTQRLQ